MKLRKWEDKLKGSNSTKGQFLRSLDFDYKDYINSSHLQIKYLLPKSELLKYKDYIVDEFYKFLEDKAR